MLFILTHLHVMFVFGFASVTVHSNVVVCPSFTANGLRVLDFTSGLSDEYSEKHFLIATLGVFIKGNGFPYYFR